MSIRRALVECAVVSLQDSCVFYPHCKGCFSRIDTDTADTRLSCSKCGYRCVRSLVDYRYRLSVRVARGNCLFGLTVFGNCLNQFFGIHATALQRLVTDSGGASDKSTLLVKAVEECFIGKHFIFGIKVTEGDHEPWVGRSTGNKNIAQLIATQMILPETAGLRGCTVLRCFEEIFQKDVEAKLCTTEKHEENLQRRLLWQPNSQTSGFTKDTRCSSFHPLSLPRSHCLNSSLSPTPPWQQTLGLITSSAEQDERSQGHKSNTSFTEKYLRRRTPLKTWLSAFPTPHPTTRPSLHVKDSPTPDITKSVISEYQEEFPLSESLTEFLKDKSPPTHNKFSLESIDDCFELVDRSQADVGGHISAPLKPNEASVEEQSQSGVYNCSADLFSNSPTINVSAESFDICHRVCASTTKARLSASSSSLTLKRTLSEKENCSILNNQEREERRESFQCSLGAHLDFIPASQSTPMEKGKYVRSNMRTKYARKCTNECFLQNQDMLKYSFTPTSGKPDRLHHQHGLELNSRLGASCLGISVTDTTLMVPPTPAPSNKSQMKLESSSINLLLEENACSTPDEECDYSKDLFY